MFTPETPDGEVSFVGIQQNIEPDGNNKYKMSFAGVKCKMHSTYCKKRFNALDSRCWRIYIYGRCDSRYVLESSPYLDTTR